MWKYFENPRLVSDKKCPTEILTFRIASRKIAKLVLRVWVLHFWGNELNFYFFGIQKKILFWDFRKSKLEFMFTPNAIEWIGAGAGYILQGGRKVMDFFILHKVLRMFRLTPPPGGSQKFENFSKIVFFEANHLKWSRTKQIHLCLGLNTCWWNFSCGRKFGKIRF